ncbi:glycine cleavage system protein H [Thermodesulfobacteriota bacterium]
MGNLAMYATKGFEYLLILGFLASFTIFYLYFTSRRFEKATAVISRSFDSLVDWFRVPDNILFHQGHTWVKREETEPDIVLVGIDDFAQKLAGPMGLKNKPAVGTFIRQGERGWSLQDGEKSVDMLAPVSGEVVEVNKDLLSALKENTCNDSELSSDPYGKGWVLKVKPDDFERERKGLLSGTLARKWMEEAVEHLRSKMSPELGAVMQDGGVPVTGMAKNINEEEWDQLLKDFFLT